MENTMVISGLTRRIAEKRGQISVLEGHLARGTFAATFLLAVLAALELEGVSLSDL